MHQAGGRISIKINGVTYSPRGKATIKPAQMMHAVQANHDGTIARSTTSKPAEADLTFDRGRASAGLARPKWDQSFMMGFYDVTIVEKDVGVMHVFAGASIIGEPAIDTETGEVAGLSIATDSYTQTNF